MQTINFNIDSRMVNKELDVGVCYPSFMTELSNINYFIVINDATHIPILPTRKSC